MAKGIYSASRNLEWEDGNVWFVYWVNSSTIDEFVDRLKIDIAVKS